MEDNDRPVDFSRLHLTVTQLCPCRDEPFLQKDELLALVEAKLSEPSFQNMLPKGQLFHDEIRKYFSSAAHKLEEFLRDTDISTTEEMIAQRIWGTCRFSRTQLDVMFEKAYSKYTKAYVEPGEAIGATGAQSISEPGTQMTLKVRKVPLISSWSCFEL